MNITCRSEYPIHSLCSGGMLLARESSFEGIKYSASLYCEILEIYASDLKIEDLVDIAKQIDEGI